MGFRNGAFASVWEVTPQNEKWTKARMTVSRKDPNSENYIVEFSGAVDFLGTATAAKAMKLKRGERIQLVSVDLSNTYDHEKQIMYWNPKCFEFKLASEVEDQPNGGYTGYARNSNHQNTSQHRQQSAPRRQQSAAYEGENEADDSDLPF